MENIIRIKEQVYITVFDPSTNEIDTWIHSAGINYEFTSIEVIKENDYWIIKQIAADRYETTYYSVRHVVKFKHVEYKSFKNESNK